MPTFVRWREPGASYFFTVVTAGRHRFLTKDRSREILRAAIERVRTKRPFEMPASVLLPDYLHCIWKMPPNDDDFPTRWRQIKSLFTHAYLQSGSERATPTLSQRAEGRRGVWQPRYWEHRIRDEADYIQHRDYIHFNPVKHQLVKTPEEWRWSTVHQHLARGELARDWWNQVHVRLPEMWE